MNEIDKELDKELQELEKNINILVDQVNDFLKTFIDIINKLDLN